MNLIVDPQRVFMENARLLSRRLCLSSSQFDYTYQDVDNISNVLAYRIDQLMMGYEGKCALVMLDDKCMTSLLAAASFKTNTRFVYVESEIDPVFVNSIINDTDCGLLITSKAIEQNFSSGHIPTLILDDLDLTIRVPNHEIKTVESIFPLTIYTRRDRDSHCKVVVDERSYLRNVDVLDKAYALSATGSVCYTDDLSLDEFVQEIIYSLSRGSHIIVADGALSDFFVTDDLFPMDFTLFYFGSYSGKIDANDKYSLLMESVKHGDENEYSAVWTPERHFNEFGGLFPNPSVLGAALAAVTSHVQIRAGSLVSPLHHSVRIAEDWSVIDNLSRGRAALSFASGWQCDDFVFYPERYDTRHQQMLKQIEEVQYLWKGGKLELKNGLGKDISVEVFPKPIQSELPVWVTVSGKTETFIDAGRIGANILTHLLWQDPSELKEKISAYRLSLKQNGFDPDGKIVSVMLHTFVGESDDKVKEVVRRPLKDYIKSSVHLIEAMTRSNDSKQKDTVGRYGNVNDKVPDHLLDELVEIAFNRFFEQAALLGSPEKCHELLKRLRDYGVNELACLIDFGLDKETILEGLEHLTKLKHNYDSRVTMKYQPTVLRTSSAIFNRIEQSESLKSVKRIVASGCSDNDLSHYANLVKLEYELADDEIFLALTGDDKSDRQPVKDLAFVNSVIDEDF